LLQELVAAEISDATGCNDDGEVWTANGTRIQTRPDVTAVVAAHNKAAWDAKKTQQENRHTAARAFAKTHPWSVMTQAEFQTWWDTNLSYTIFSFHSLRDYPFDPRKGIYFHLVHSCIHYSSNYKNVCWHGVSGY
jgi:hypothetical protein